MGLFWCSGIGIVNAIEVVNAFSEEDGLHKFREWIESPDPSILGKLDVKTGSNGKKKGSKANLKGPKRSAEGASESDQSSLQADDNQQAAEHDQDMKQIFMDNHVIQLFTYVLIFISHMHRHFSCRYHSF